MAGKNVDFEVRLLGRLDRKGAFALVGIWICRTERGHGNFEEIA